jgi:ribonuclease HII
MTEEIKVKNPRVKKEYNLLPYQDINKIEICIDECARGCGFGSTFIGVVLLPTDFAEKAKAEKVIIRDSKKMSAKQREKSFHFIKTHALAYSIVSKDNKRIDEMNILQAVMEGMHDGIKNVLEIIENVNFNNIKILVDGDKFNPFITEDGIQIEHETVVEGDGTYIGIACASILAKHAHDTWIKELVEENPELKEYDIQNNQGYLTAKHLAKIRERNASKKPLTQWHRLSFGICRENVASKFAPRVKVEKEKYNSKNNSLNEEQKSLSQFKFTDEYNSDDSDDSDKGDFDSDEEIINI